MVVHIEMKIKHSLGILLALSLLLGAGASFRATAQSPSGSHLHVLRSDEQSILLELTVESFETEVVETGGQTYHRLIIPDMVQTDAPGAPQVPTRGALLGLPASEGVSVRVLQADYETLPGYRLCPAPGWRVTGDYVDTPTGGGVEPYFTLDRALYATDALYPGRPAEIDTTGYLRDQAVAQVRFYPVQYNPVTGELRLYRRIVAQITWDSSPSTAAAQARGTNPAFESLLTDVVLNYSAVSRPSAAPPTDHGTWNTQLVSATSSPTPTLKIGVTEDGLHELTSADLTGAGLDLSGVDPRTIKVSNQGAEVAILVTGEEDGVFDSGDTVLFYGTAVEDLYTSENVYWLTAGGANGRRIPVRDGTPNGAPVATHFPAVLHAEEDSYYWSEVTGGAGQDHWFWGNRFTAPVMQTYTLDLHNISTAAATTTVRVQLKGRSRLFVDPDHHTEIYLNGQEIDDGLWDGQAVYDHETTVSHSLLQDGSNSIAVRGVGDVGFLDQFHLNWIEIDYWDTYVAEGDELSFGAPSSGTFQFQVTHFSTSDVQVFDVTDPVNVAIFGNVAVTAGAGRYQVQFEDTAQADTRYLALVPTRHKTPVRVELDQPSSWRSPAHGADYVVITHGDFYTSSLRLAAHREITTGLRVATVQVEDIYDEFNYGVFNPQAIRDFLAYAYQYWGPPAPTFVLLVGDATSDYKDNLGTGAANYVPSQLVEIDFQTASDNWFVLVNGDDILPDMFIGRLPAQTVSQVDNMVDKIITYEQSPPGVSWNRNVLLVADDVNPDFEGVSEQIADLLPAGYFANRVYADDYPPGDPTGDIAAAINGGSVLVSYVGHGTTVGWGQWSGGNRIFELSDIEALNNGLKLPIVTMASCLNGLFTLTDPEIEVVVAEAFLRLQDRGAVATWASTGYGYTSGHEALMGEFYETIFQDGEHALGAATTAAKIASYNQSSSWDDLVQTFVLFGDPVTPFHNPDMYPVYLPLVIAGD